MDGQPLIPHLFRTEYSKIVAVLCKLLGIAHIDTAEDIASEAFLTALNTWPHHGIPENPQAWLYTVAKNKAKNHLRRSAIFYDKVAPEVRRATDPAEEMPIDLSESNITDSQLQMLFAICHPSIAPESQVGLALRILCGFGIDEIATAFLTNKEVINKRLYRAREKLRDENVAIAFPAASELVSRLEPVLTTLYLLFSEGYYSEDREEVIREDLCLEAMRLTHLLTSNAQTTLPKVNALLSLMCFQASRLKARKAGDGLMVLYADQDETLWDRELIARGAGLLRKASVGEEVSKYHLEAQIAWWHTIKAGTKDKWENILHLYNQLLMVAYTPVAALNRTYALAMVKGREAGIGEAEKLKLTGSHFYYALLAELYTGIDDRKAAENLKAALKLSKTFAEKRVLQGKLEALTSRVK